VILLRKNNVFQFFYDQENTETFRREKSA